MDYNNLFTNEQDDQQTTQELVIRAPPEVDLEELADELGSIPGLELSIEPVDEDGSGAAAGDGPEADQQALAQQAKRTQRAVDSVVEGMSWGLDGAPAGNATARQLRGGQNSRSGE